MPRSHGCLTSRRVRRRALRELIGHAVAEAVGDVVGARFLRLRTARLPVVEAPVPEVAEADLDRVAAGDVGRPSRAVFQVNPSVSR